MTNHPANKYIRDVSDQYGIEANFENLNGKPPYVFQQIQRPERPITIGKPPYVFQQIQRPERRFARVIGRDLPKFKLSCFRPITIRIGSAKQLNE